MNIRNFGNVSIFKCTLELIGNKGTASFLVNITRIHISENNIINSLGSFLHINNCRQVEIEKMIMKSMNGSRKLDFAFINLLDINIITIKHSHIENMVGTVLNIINADKIILEHSFYFRYVKEVCLKVSFFGQISTKLIDISNCTFLLCHSTIIQQ